MPGPDGGFTGDGGAATSARLNAPQALRLDSAGALYIADTANNRIRSWHAGIITTVTGTGTAGSAGTAVRRPRRRSTRRGIAVTSTGAY